MLKLPLILRIYCICAILVLLWYGYLILADVRLMHAQAATLQSEIAQLADDDSRAEDVYNDLEAKQRRERSGYTGQDAVAASVAVMDAKAEFEALHAQLGAAQLQHANLITQAASLQLRIVPVLAIVLLHLFGFFMISTERRDQASRRR